MPQPVAPLASPFAAALELARQAVGLSDPNPRVGCVILSGDGQRVLGQGHTQAAGQAHAEVMALRDAQARGHDVRGATVYVTLEPCAHHGRTPPCCDALIAAGVGRVIAALGDPNPAVNGQGMARLRAAGIATEWAGADVAAEARELNIGFLSRMARGRPWIRMKMASSLDGRTALEDGRSQWITGPQARADGHAWRCRAGMVLTGVGTVLADDPQLDVRLVPCAHQPLRAVVDARLDTPPGARLLRTGGQGVVFYAAAPSSERLSRMRDLGTEVLCLPAANGQVDLAQVLGDLAHRAINELHIEAGARLSGAWLQHQLVDEILLYLAPKLIGPGRALADLPPLGDLSQAQRWHWQDVQHLGDDLRVMLRPA